VHLVLTDSPWPEFEAVVGELFGAFGFPLADASDADLTVKISINGEETAIPYTRAFRKVFPTGKPFPLTIGYRAETSVTALAADEAVWALQLLTSEGGPQTLPDGWSIEQLQGRSRRISFENTLGKLCNELYQRFPKRLPLEMIRSGSISGQQVCLEWLPNGSTLTAMQTAIFDSEIEDVVLARAIATMTSWHYREELSRFQSWLLSPIPDVQIAAARKLAENSPKFSGDGQWRLEPTTWMLDAIDSANADVRLVLIDSVSRAAGGDRGDYGSPKWKDWCLLQNRLMPALRGLTADPDPRIRLRLRFHMTYPQRCDLAQNDPDEKVRSAMKSDIASSNQRRRIPVCSCANDFLTCTLDGIELSPTTSSEQLKSASEKLRSAANSLSRVQTEAEIGSYLVALSQVREYMGQESLPTVTYRDGTKADAFELEFDHAKAGW